MTDASIILNELNRQLEMEQVRDGFEDHMQKAFDYVNPRRYDLRNVHRKGSQRKTGMYDGTAQDAFFTWVDGMIGWGINEGLDWHRAAILERQLRENDAVQKWLQEYTEQMEWEVRTGKYYDVVPEFLQDGGSAGTAVTYTDEARDKSRSVHRIPHPGSYWIAQNEDYEIDVYHEIQTFSARQAIRKFSKPGDTMHPIVKKWSEDAQSSLWECDFLNCICPADDPAIFAKNPTVGNKPWAIVTILYGFSSGDHVNNSQLLNNGEQSQRLIRVGGLDHFPPTVWRFRRNSDELYGYSPAMDVMSVIEALQKHGKNLLDMGNFAANPMLLVPEEKRYSFKRLPGERVGYASEKRTVSTIPYGTEYPIAVDRENKMQQLVYKRYGYGVWNMMEIYREKRERNQVGEIFEARADQARLLSGQFGNFWSGGVRHTYDNIAYLAARAGRMPPAPAELQDYRGKDIVIPVFVGPLSQLQIQSTKLGPIRQGLSLLGEVAEIIGRHVGPEDAAKIYDRINLPDLTEYVCDNTNFPQALMNSDDVVAGLTRAREDQARARAQAETARELAAAAGQLGKEPGPNSLLARGAA